ncbi:hypothetical protein HK405_005852 [Cladochytrium tenue]|nr:hypothetical protein HK405_005852 [Cladochytrium tenue]
MPELPEVERGRRLVHRACLGKRIVRVDAVRDDIVFVAAAVAAAPGGGGGQEPSPPHSGVSAAHAHEHFMAHLRGRRVVDTGRRGKVFFVLLDCPPHPVLHFGMTGSVRPASPLPPAPPSPHSNTPPTPPLPLPPLPPPPEHGGWPGRGRQVKGEEGLRFVDFDTSGDEWPPRFCKFVLAMDDGTELAFTDPRRLARVRLLADPLNQPPVADLGPDPLLHMPDVQAFTGLVRERSRPVKALLLDQSFIAGIGNWIADEVLYQAHIHPQENTALMTDAELSRLHASIVHITTFACSVNADSDQFPDSWLFHHRWYKGKKAAATRSSNPATAGDDEGAGDGEDNSKPAAGPGRRPARSAKGSPRMPDGNPIVFQTVAGRTSAIVPAVQRLRHAHGVRSKQRPAGPPAPDSAEGDTAAHLSSPGDPPPSKLRKTVVRQLSSALHEPGTGLVQSAFFAATPSGSGGDRGGGAGTADLGRRRSERLRRNDTMPR